MNNVVAIRVKGELETRSPLGLTNEIYPLGQHLRGAMGYVFLDLGLSKLSETYLRSPVLYFKDAFVKCNCMGGEGLMIPVARQDTSKGMILKEIVYKCSKCGRLAKDAGITKNKSIGIKVEEERTGSFVIDTIPEKTKFGLNVIIKMKHRIDNRNNGINRSKVDGVDMSEYLSQFLSAIDFVKKNGLELGKRSMKGLGKMELKNVIVEKIEMENIEKRADAIEGIARKDGGKISVHLLSDTILKNGVLTGDTITGDVKNAFSFFHPHWNEIRDEYKAPKIIGIGNPIDLGRKSVTYMHGKGDVPAFDKVDNVISRGSKYSFQVEGINKIGSEFWQGLAMAEMLRGLGDKTSMGKGQFVIM